MRLWLALVFIVLASFCGARDQGVLFPAARSALPAAFATLWPGKGFLSPLQTPRARYFPATGRGSAIATLPPIVSFQIQYAGQLDTTIDVDVFNLDLFDTPPEVIGDLRNRGVFVMCYFSAGSYEDWRPDASHFPPAVLGNELVGWPGERWLDIRQLDLLAPIMEARLDLAVEKGCHGVDPDNVNGYENETGFPLTGQDQLRYNRFLSAAAHQRGLAIGLKNDLSQVLELVADFDWVLNESCFTYQECYLLQPFREAGKPVFIIEYEGDPRCFCPLANQMGFNALLKHRELDAFRIECRTFRSVRRHLTTR